jgi:hypothetical protein
MRDYPQIHFGLQIIKLAVLSVERKVVCDDEDIKVFIEDQYLKPWSRRFSNKCLNALDFGYAPIELVWTSQEYEGAEKWVLSEMRSPDPEECVWLADEKGQYNGFEQQKVELPRVPADKSVWYAYDDEFGNLYGTPATKPCYTPWYNHEMLTLYMLREAERFGSPFVKVRYPPDIVADTTNETAAKAIGRDVKDNSYVTLPAMYDEASRNPLWDLEVVPAAGEAAHWIEQLNYFNTEMFRALHIPDRVATQDEVGSEALSRTHKGIHTQNIDGIVWGITDAENEHVVKKLVEYNFDNPPTCYLEAEVLADDKREFILDIVKSILHKASSNEPIGWRLMEGARQKLEEMGFEMPEEDEFVPPEPEEDEFGKPTKPGIKGKKKEPMPAGEGSLEAEAPPGWKVEFRQLHSAVKGDLENILDDIGEWAGELDEENRYFEVPYKSDYKKALEFGAIEAFDLAAKSQAREFGTSNTPDPGIREDVRSRIHDLVNKQFDTDTTSREL